MLSAHRGYPTELKLLPKRGAHARNTVAQAQGLCPSRGQGVKAQAPELRIIVPCRGNPRLPQHSSRGKIIPISPKSLLPPRSPRGKVANRVWQLSSQIWNPHPFPQRMLLIGNVGSSLSDLAQYRRHVAAPASDNTSRVSSPSLGIRSSLRSSGPTPFCA